MNISKVVESGSNNILRWAIANGADIKNDLQLQSLVNDETCYLVTISDVNFFELFRLTQMYREKVRLIDEKKADIPPRKELLQFFDGEFIEDPEEKPDQKVPLYELVEYACQNFINLALQMQSDSDIIHPETIRMFIPMLCRKFDVQIPIGFMDLVSFIPTAEEAQKLFNNEYPSNLNEYIIDTDNSPIRNMMYLGLVKGTSIIRYDEHYDQLLKAVKYAPLAKCSEEKIFKQRLSGFFKYDNISRGEVRCNMFNPDKGKMIQNMKHMARISTPLKAEFVVQMPIQYMQLILNQFSREELPVMYESSMTSIIDGGIRFNDFVTHGYDETSQDETVQSKIVEHNNSIEAYQRRIGEANQILLNTIPIMIRNPGDVDFTATFAMLPSIYSTKAVFVLSMDKIDKYVSHYDPVVSDMFQDMAAVMEKLQEDIAKSK